MLLYTHHIVLLACSAFIIQTYIFYNLMNFIYFFSWYCFSITFYVFTFFIIILSTFKVWSFELTRSWRLNLWNFIILYHLIVFNTVLILGSFWFVNIILIFGKNIVLLIYFYVCVYFVVVFIFVYYLMVPLILNCVSFKCIVCIFIFLPLSWSRCRII